MELFVDVIMIANPITATGRTYTLSRLLSIYTLIFSVSLFINSTFKEKYLQIAAILILYWIINN